MKIHRRWVLFVFLFSLFYAVNAFAKPPEAKTPLSPETEACLGCHDDATPGIVKDWLSSRHARVTPTEALKKSKLERRVSNENIPENLKGKVVGCFECHSRNADKHADNFNHFDYKINVIVSPDDCKTCHLEEAQQYADSKKAHAVGNLDQNPLYHTLVDTIIGRKEIKGTKTTFFPPSEGTEAVTCYSCHGTEVKVEGMKEIEVPMGKIQVPNLTNWPNQGVGRINPDKSRGSCTACHPRHSFSIEIARKPYTCSQCHLDPDVPAWNVYKESKHGNIFFSKYQEWNFDNVPWVVGRDFKAPTCATCHNSLVVAEGGTVLAPRTHDFGARMWVRLFGLVYAHPQPKRGATYIIKNKDGLPLPTTFTNEPAGEFLIDAPEQAKRRAAMTNLCRGCHNTQLIENHWQHLDTAVAETNQMTLEATKLLVKAWDLGLADRKNPFDEYIEQLWIQQWLFYSNSIRYATAMTGAPDYAAFKNGWWNLSKNLQEMKDWLEVHQALKKRK
jgi:hypothetical protein